MSASNFQTETYAGFRKEFLKEVSGGELWDRLEGDHLFLNIYDFWCVRRHKLLVDNYAQRNSFLKKITFQLHYKSTMSFPFKFFEKKPNFTAK